MAAVPPGSGKGLTPPRCFKSKWPKLLFSNLFLLSVNISEPQSKDSSPKPVPSQVKNTASDLNSKADLLFL
jgi:hypothetical protein